MSSLSLPLTLPLLTFYLWLCVDEFGGTLVFPSSQRELIDLISRIPRPTSIPVFVYASWLLVQAALQIAAPGKVHEGTPLSGGTRLKYKMNGWFSFWFSLGVIALATVLGWIPSTFLYDQFGALLVTANLFAFAFSFYLYFRGKERNGRNAIRDYVMGTELNPRIGAFDLKLFFEARPGLMLWILMNFSFAAKQYEMHGYVTTPMMLVTAFQFLYVADYYFHEEAILTTWDIKHEKFGWMLCWGNLVWVPFIYSLQAHYLVSHTHELSLLATAAIIALNVIGYTIFRGANLQKHQFRKDPKVLVWGKPAEYIQTSQGTMLLTSGWWGIARHMNYSGDLLMALAWCLPTGFEHPLPYFYFAYFTILLLHRERRDNAMCQAKYGKDWETYCRKVRWRFLPGLY